jgi:hypothetical protein
MHAPIAKRLLCLLVGIYCCLPVCVQSAEPAAGLPLADSTPWDLERLGKAPDFEWVDAEGPVRSLFYQGEPYQGQPTAVRLLLLPAPCRAMPRATQTCGGRVGARGAARHFANGPNFGQAGYAYRHGSGRLPARGKQNPHSPENRTRLPDGGPNRATKKIRQH